MLSPETGELSPRTEALLYAADKAEHVATVVEPALARGEVVITDRYVDSTLAYQGAGRPLDVSEIAEIARWATTDLRPDLTVLLDLAPSHGLSRFDERDRIEAEGLAFHERVRAAFLHLADASPEHRPRCAAAGRRDRRGDPSQGRAVARQDRWRGRAVSVWDTLVGQQAAIDVLRRAAEGRGMTHAWLFTGPPGSGRSNVALAFAAALQCERGTGCGECRACRTTLAGSASRRSVMRTEKLSLGVDDVRELVRSSALAPVGSGGR